jgi:fatty-acyl-CoA synthase
MYKSGGENVFCAEVELVLREHPDIAEVAIIGVPDAKWGEVGRALIVPSTRRSISLDAIREYCASRLARYKHPTSVVIIDEIPRNVTGKIQKAELQRRFGD